MTFPNHPALTWWSPIRTDTPTVTPSPFCPHSSRVPAGPPRAGGTCRLSVSVLVALMNLPPFSSQRGTPPCPLPGHRASSGGSLSPETMCGMGCKLGKPGHFMGFFTGHRSQLLTIPPTALQTILVQHKGIRREKPASGYQRRN